LVSCVVTPGFEYADLEMGRRDELMREWPAAQEVIGDLS
jgi:predicted cupin superfamily sugar epimerase